MKKYLKILIPLTVLIILVACMRGGNEPVSEPNPTLDTPPLQNITPEDPTPIPDPTTEPPLEADPITESGAVTGSASPAEVDLSQVTSQPPTVTTPQVMPQPGVPDPKIVMAHVVSQDLAQRLGIDVNEVSTVTVDEVQWPDSSLGCPALETVYVTIMTPGYMIVLEASGQSYLYHTDQPGNFVLCGDDGQPVSK